MKLFRTNDVCFLCLFFLMLCVTFYSCKDDEVIPGIQGDYLGYFPLTQGQWIEYDADSIVHLDIDDAFYLDTAVRIYRFQIREEIDSSFYDSEGMLSWRISRYKRFDENAPWTFLNLWTAKVSNYSAQRVEDNIRFIKLSFPFDPRTSWNGNAFNSFPVEEYSYKDIHSSKSINSYNFDSTVTVVQNDFISGINRIDKREVYAKNIGMVYKVLDSLNTVILPSGLTLILNGAEYKLQISDYKR